MKAHDPCFEIFTVDIDFYCGTLWFGRETYAVSALGWYQAERTALERSLESPFDNDRIPGLRRRATARPL